MICGRSNLRIGSNGFVFRHIPWKMGSWIHEINCSYAGSHHFTPVPTGMISQVDMGTAGSFPHKDFSSIPCNSCEACETMEHLNGGTLSRGRHVRFHISSFAWMLRGQGFKSCMHKSTSHWIKAKPQKKKTWCVTLFWLLRFSPTLTLFEEKTNVYWVHEVFQRFIWSIFEWFLWCERMLPKPSQPTVECSVPFNILTVNVLKKDACYYHWPWWNDINPSCCI